MDTSPEIPDKDAIQQLALEAIRDLPRASVNISMGVGKTLFGLKDMDRNLKLDSKFLVVAPKLSIITSWKTEAMQHGYEHLLPYIKFSTYISLSKQEKDYDIVYLDECHNLLESHKKWLDSYSGKIRGLTGTPPRSSYGIKAEMVNKYCPIAYNFEVDQAIDNKILNDYKIYVHYLELDNRNNVEVKSSKRTWYTSESKSYNFWSDRVEEASTPKSKQISRIMRMKAMMNYNSKLVYCQKFIKTVEDKCIIFANYTEQADALSPYSYHSKNPQSEKNLQDFKEGKIKILSTVLQLSEGTNIPNLKQGIILHAYGNERKASQRIKLPVLYKSL